MAASLAVFYCAVFVSVATESAAQSSPHFRRIGTVTTTTSGQLCTNNGEDIFCDSTTPTISGGAVGIGTTTPQSLLQIYNGEVQVGSSGASCATANAGAIRFSGSSIYYCNGTSWVIDGSGAAAGSTGDVQFNGGSGAFAADSNFFWDNTNKRLGIGTTTPTNILSLSGSASQTFWMERNPTSNTAGNGLTVEASGATLGATDKNGGNLVLSSGIATGAGSSNIQFQTTNAGASGTTDRSPATAMTILGNGNVGIGSPNPAVPLEVGGTSPQIRAISAGGVDIRMNTSGGATLGTWSNHPLIVNTNASEKVRISTNGNVGIGSTTPGAKLTLTGTEALNLGSDYTTTGLQSDVAINTASAFRYNGAGTATFYGIVAGVSGQVLILHNASASTLTLSNQSGSEATAANQIITGTGADLPVPTNTSVTMQYDGTASRWRITGSSNSANTLAAGSTGQVQFNGGTNLAADSNLFWDNTNKRLGIGTASPTNALSIAGSENLTGNLTLDATVGTVSPIITLVARNAGTAASTSILANLLGGLSLVPVSGRPVSVGNPFNASTGAIFQVGGNAAIGYPVNTVGPTNGLAVNGNVGIGTTSPTNLLSLSGSASQTFWMERNPTANTAGNSLTVESSGATSGATDKNGGDLILSSGIATGAGSSNIQFQTFPAGSTGTSDNTATTAMTVTGAGNVGIGTTSPPTGIKAAINGVVKVAGTGSETCNSSTVGAMGYNAAGQYMEICAGP